MAKLQEFLITTLTNLDVKGVDVIDVANYLADALYHERFSIRRSHYEDMSWLKESWIEQELC